MIDRDLQKRFPVYSWLLRFYPVSYRREFGNQILQTTADMLDHAPTRRARMALWLRLTLDVPFNLGRQQVMFLGEVMQRSTKSNSTMWFRPRRFGIGYAPHQWQGWLIAAIIVGLGVAVAFIARAFRPEWFGYKIFGLGIRPVTWQGWIVAGLIMICLFAAYRIAVAKQPKQ